MGFKRESNVLQSSTSESNVMRTEIGLLLGGMFCDSTEVLSLTLMLQINVDIPFPCFCDFCCPPTVSTVIIMFLVVCY